MPEFKRVFLLCLLLALTACGGPGSEAVAGNQDAGAAEAAADTAAETDALPAADSAVEEVEEPAGSAPTTTPQPAADTPATTPDLGVPTGQNEDGTFYIGNPDADVVLIDYSDFL